jgi:ABC-type iron transport system FetAB permease component
MAELMVFLLAPMVMMSVERLDINKGILWVGMRALHLAIEKVDLLGK